VRSSVGRDIQSIDAADHLAIRHLKRDDPLADFRPGIVDHEPCFLEQFPASGPRVTFAGIKPTPRRGPESLPRKRTLLMLEPEQQDALQRIDDQQPGRWALAHD